MNKLNGQQLQARVDQQEFLGLANQAGSMMSEMDRLVGEFDAYKQINVK